MASKTVDVAEAQSQLLELVQLVQQGEEIIIVEHNMPLAKLVSLSPSENTRVPGLNRGAMHMHDTFNEPLPDTFWSDGS